MSRYYAVRDSTEQLVREISAGATSVRNVRFTIRDVILTVKTTKILQFY